LEKLQGSIYLIGGFALAGTSVIAARFVTQRLGTFTITAASLFFTILCLLPLCWSGLKRISAQMQARDWLALLFQATCGIFLFRMFLIQGLVRTSAGEAGILTGATPATTAVLAFVLLKEPVRPKMVLGILMTVSGIVLLQGALLSGNGFSREHFLGNLLVLCAAVCESFFNVVSRSGSLRGTPGAPRKMKTAEILNTEPQAGITPASQTFFVATFAFLLCLAPAAFEQPLPALRSLGIKEWLALAWYGLFVTALAFIFFYAGIRRCSASSAAVFSGMMPFTALVLSVLILGETAGWQQWTGGGLIVLGMALIGGGESGLHIGEMVAET
jgi:drug/metabolite transporter (DMT)-like permease